MRYEGMDDKYTLFSAVPSYRRKGFAHSSMYTESAFMPIPLIQENIVFST